MDEVARQNSSARTGTTDDAEVGGALDRLVRLPIERYPLEGLVQRAWARWHRRAASERHWERVHALFRRTLDQPAD